MRWEKVDQRWAKYRAAAPGADLDSGVSYQTELWEIPGETPLEIRVCTRKGVPTSKFSSPRSTTKTSIVLHITAGYGGFYTLMGNDGSRQCSAHFMLGRDGMAYLLVPTEHVAWHATWWNDNSVGIEVDSIGRLHKKGSDLCSDYGEHDAYCKPDETNVFWEVNWPGRGKQLWATWPEDQYRGLGRLIKAISHKHQIPRVVLPEPARYAPFQRNGNDRQRYKGLCTHLQIDPERRSDIGPYIDRDKLIRYADLQQADCFNAPAYAPSTNPTPLPDGTSPAPGQPTQPQSPVQTQTPATPKPPAQAAPQTPAAPPTSTQEYVQLPAPVRIDDATVRVNIGKRGGRVAFTVRKPGEPVPTAPKPGDLPPPQADGKRDEFLRHAMNFLGAPYKPGSRKPDEGIDGVGLVAICLKRVGLLKEIPERLDGPGLNALWGSEGGTVDEVPACILPGDLAFFGQGDHDTDPAQHPMIYLGGGRVLGPVPNGGAHDGAVQVLKVKEMPESFAGWTHIDDLGVTTQLSEHPGEHPAAGEKLTGALLPLTPAGRYDALKAIVEKKGGAWEAGKNKVNLVGIKNMAERCLISPVPEGWNDTLFAAFLDDDGHKCCLELKASLNPENDKENDRRDTWQLQEGPWKFKAAEAGGTKALQPEGKIKGWLDKDGTGAPRGGDVAPADTHDVMPVPPAPQDNPNHPQNPDNPANNPPTPQPAPYSGPATGRSTGAWEEFIGKDEPVTASIIDQIVAARGKFPKHELTVTKFGQNKGPYIRVYYGANIPGHKGYLRDYMNRRVANAKGKVDKFVASCYRTLLGREGNTASLNLYDNMIVTWGTGFGANNGGLMLLLDFLQKQSEAVRNVFHNVGFLYDHAKKAFHVVDVRDKKIKSSSGRDHTAPLEAWRQQDELLFAFTGLATQPETRDAVTEANLWTYAQHSGSFPAADRLDSQGAFNFISHLHHWCPGYAGGCIKAAIADGRANDDLEIVTYAARHFVKKHHASSKPLNLNWNQLNGMWNEMVVDGLSVPSASTMDFGI